MIYKRLRVLLPNLLMITPLLVLGVVQSWIIGVNVYLIAFCISVYVLALLLVSYRISSEHLQQMGIISDLLEALIEGDFSLRGKDLYSPHFQSLLSLVNQLASTLQSQTVALRESQLLIQQVIDHMEAALIAIDADGLVIFSNRAARQLLSLTLSTTNTRLSPEVLKQLMTAKNGQSLSIEGLHSEGEYLLHREHFYTQSQHNHLFVLSEVGELLHDNEAAAWQRLVRVISHEINNSMAPIGTISRTMLRSADKHQLPENYRQGLGVIKNRSEHLVQFIASYSKVAQLPLPNRQLMPLEPLLRQCMALFDRRTIELSGDLAIDLYCDPAQLQQVVINLIKNADEAMEDLSRPIVITASKTAKQFVLSVTDEGCGISNQDNLFVPFYTTKESGSGIGLMLSQQIISNHFGQLTLTNRTDQRDQVKIRGVVARIALPFQGQNVSEKMYGDSE